jgi:hypothetical protein
MADRSQAPVRPASYYLVPAVRRRILEYAGALRSEPSCAYFSAIGPEDDSGARDWAAAPRCPPDGVDALLARGVDVARSLWDSRCLLLFLEIDYLNVDYPGEPFLHPADVFLKLEPVYQASRRVFRSHDLPLLSLMTGRGYHFVGRLPLKHPLVDRCAALVPETPAWHRASAARRLPWAPFAPDARHARAYAGTGLLLEFLVHAIIREAAACSPLAIVLNGTVVGTGLVGRECVSLDLSHAGDPLDVRHVRAAFSTYQRHRMRPDIFSASVATRVPPLVTVPRNRRSLLGALALRASLPAAARLAARCRARVPIVSRGIARLLDEYEASPLAAVHRAFHAAPTPSPDAFPPDRIDSLVAGLPPCAAEVVRYPNDLLLRPAELQHLTRMLLARGWAPREVAALVHARYRHEAGWGTRWTRLDPATRAEFDVRVFASMLAVGLDAGVDFNCTSTQEKGLCPPTRCDHDLRRDHRELLRRLAR